MVPAREIKSATSHDLLNCCRQKLANQILSFLFADRKEFVLAIILTTVPRNVGVDELVVLLILLPETLSLVLTEIE